MKNSSSAAALISNLIIYLLKARNISHTLECLMKKLFQMQIVHLKMFVAFFKQEKKYKKYLLLDKVKQAIERVDNICHSQLIFNAAWLSNCLQL